MKKILTQLILCLVMLLSFIPDQAYAFRIWTAIRIGQDFTTSYDIQRHVELIHLSDQARRALFRLSESDYGRYEQAITQMASPELENALKSIAYARLIESIATSSIRRDQRREAFTVTTEQFNREMNEHESKVLKSWLDQRLGIVVARREYARQLRAEYFPHRENESDEQVYFRWLDEEKYKIKERLHQREVSKYEQARISRLVPSRLNRPLEIHDLYVDISKIVDQELQGKQLSAQEVARVRSAHPELNVIVQDIRALGLQGSSLYRIQQHNPNKLNQSLRLLQTRFNPSLSETRLERLTHYEKMAYEMVQKYQDPRTLADLSDERLKSFTSGESHNDFMMARIYNLAKLQLELNPNREQTVSRVIENVRRAMDWIKQQNQTGGVFLDESYQALLYEDAIVKGIRDFLGVGQISDAYEKAYLEMAIWVLKFEAKRVSLQDQSIIHVTTLPYRSSQTYRRLESFLNQRDFQNGYQQFLRMEVAPQAYRIEINPTGSRMMQGQQAFEYIRQ